jgi:hypothetical protein
VLTNAVALIGVAHNRSGDPDSVLVLTRRELQMPYRWWRVRENSGIDLRLLWRMDKEEIGDEIDAGNWYAGTGGTAAWLGTAKLAERQIRPVVSGSGRSLRLSGYVSGLSVDEINVPLEFRSVFERALPDSATGVANPIRFDATVAFGKRFEPWITAAARSSSN